MFTKCALDPIKNRKIWVTKVVKSMLGYYWRVYNTCFGFICTFRALYLIRILLADASWKVLYTRSLFKVSDNLPKSLITLWIFNQIHGIRKTHKNIIPNAFAFGSDKLLLNLQDWTICNCKVFVIAQSTTKP